jgi:hypothetical protein
LPDAIFIRVLPLVRRCFAAFDDGERRDLANCARVVIAPQSSALTPDWDAARALLPLPLLRRIWGLSDPAD